MVNVNAATINVPGDYPTIQQAIDNASDGDTIIVAAGTYTEQLIINKSIDLIGQSGAKIVAPNNASRNTYKIQESGHTFDPIVFAYGGTYSAGNNTVWGSGVIHVNISGFEIDGNNGWYVSNVKVSFAVEDDSSDVTTYYRIDGSKWHIYDATIYHRRRNPYNTVLQH